jgi:hypothetical protein
MSFSRRTLKVHQVWWELGVSGLDIMHGLFVRYLAFGAGQKKNRDSFLPDASSRVRRRRRDIEPEENK